MLAAAAFGLYPYLLPSIGLTEKGPTIYNAAASSYGLGIGLVWFIPGLALVGSYFLFAYRHIFEKLQTGRLRFRWQTPAFHVGNTGSNPVRDASKIEVGNLKR